MGHCRKEQGTLSCMGIFNDVLNTRRKEAFHD
jgi:hypothetical protein